MFVSLLRYRGILICDNIIANIRHASLQERAVRMMRENEVLIVTTLVARNAWLWRRLLLAEVLSQAIGILLVCRNYNDSVLF
jgi:hypothetical protein